jgi:hypothetical protein
VTSQMEHTAVPAYANTYENLAFTRDEDGVLLLRFRTDGGPIVFTGQTHEDLPGALEEIALDSDNKDLVITGSGDSFMARDTGGDAFTSSGKRSREPRGPSGSCGPAKRSMRRPRCSGESSARSSPTTARWSGVSRSPEASPRSRRCTARSRSRRSISTSGAGSRRTSRSAWRSRASLRPISPIRASPRVDADRFGHGWSAWPSRSCCFISSGGACSSTTPGATRRSPGSGRSRTRSTCATPSTPTTSRRSTTRRASSSPTASVPSAPGSSSRSATRRSCSR